MNIAQIRIFGNYQKCRKWMVFERLSSKIPLFFSKFFLLEFFSDPKRGKWLHSDFHIYNSSKVTTKNVNPIFRFSRFSGFPYIKSLRKRGGKSKIRKISKFQTAVKIALVDEFKRNPWQMEALGLYFRDFFEF